MRVIPLFLIRFTAACTAGQAAAVTASRGIEYWAERPMPEAVIAFQMAVFALALVQSLAPDAAPGGAFGPPMRLRRAALPLAAVLACLATAIAAVGTLALSVMLDADTRTLPPQAALTLALFQTVAAYVILRRMTDPSRILQRGSAAASRASASIPAQSPLAILSLGATQLPPTHSVFGSDR